MIKAIIIEDEEASRSVLKSIIGDYCPELYIVGEAISVVQGVEMIRRDEPDLIFIDIQLSDGTAFDILNQFKSPSFKLIFITAHDEFALQSFKYNVVDYVLKPFSYRDIRQSIKKLGLIKDDSESVRKIEKLINQANLIGAKRIPIHTTDGIKMISMNSIIRIEADGAYCTVHLLNESSHVISKPMKDIVSSMDQDMFIRIHNSHTVNKYFVEGFSNEDQMIQMTNGSSVPLARRRKQEFLERIDNVE